jgi:hypothetical protein
VPCPWHLAPLDQAGTPSDERHGGTLQWPYQQRAGDSSLYFLEQTFNRYAWLYNYHILQEALHHQAPLAAMKEWQSRLPELFTKRVVNHTGSHTSIIPLK